MVGKYKRKKSHLSKAPSLYPSYIITMESKNSCNIEFENPVLIRIIPKYIDKYIMKVLYKMLKLIKNL